MAPWLDAPGLSSALCSPLASCQLSAGAAALVAGEWRSIHALRKSTQGMAGDRAVPSLDGHQHRKAQHFLHIPIYTILKFLKDAMRARCHLLGLKIFLSVQSRRRSNDSVVALATLWMPKALRLWSGLSAKPWNLVTWRVARPRRPFGGRFLGMDWAWHGAIWNGRLRWKIDPSRVQHRNVDESKPISTYIHTHIYIYIYISYMWWYGHPFASYFAAHQFTRVLIHSRSQMWTLTILTMWIKYSAYLPTLEMGHAATHPIGWSPPF